MSEHENKEQQGASAREQAGGKSSEHEPTHVPKNARDDVAERPGTAATDHDHADKLVDEWSEDSFPGSDPPAHY